MVRKPVYAVYLSCLVVILCLGTSLDTLGQLSDFGLPKQQTEAPKQVTAHGVLSIDKVQPGSTFQIAIVMEFAETWHANANPAGAEHLIPTQVILPDVQGLTFGEIVYPKGDLLKIESLGEDPLPVYHDKAIIGVEATLNKTVQLAPITLPLQLTYQACTDAQCLLPQTINIDIPVKVVGLDESIQRVNDEIFAGIQFGNPSSGTPSLVEGGWIGRALSEGQLWLAFLATYALGILTSLTPCVYPLIPITVSIFGANESTGRLRSFLLSVTYVLGIAVMFSILGVAAAKTGAVFGQLMTNPYVIGPICAILVALALSMFGVFELRLPYAMQNKLNQVGGTGFIGAFAMGTVAGIIAAPCTGPALAFMLTYVATTGDIVLGFSLMLTYALGIGLLFILIGTFSSIILPKSGNWMYILENVFGILVITVALYFLKEVIEPLRAFLSNSIGFFAIAGVLLVVGILLGQLTKRFKDLPVPVQFRKAFGLLLAVVGLYMVVGGITTVNPVEERQLLFEVELATATDLDSNTIPGTLLTAFEQHKITLSQNATIAVEEQDSKWLVSDKDNEQTFLLEKEEGILNVYRYHVNWLYDEAAGLEIAKREGKLVMLDFYATWCAACIELDKYTYANSVVASRLSEYVNVKLDFSSKSEEGERLKEKYEIRGLPVVIFLDSDGNPLKRFDEFIEAEKFLTILDALEQKEEAKRQFNGELN